jgi:hypothetical protein
MANLDPRRSAPLSLLNPSDEARVFDPNIVGKLRSAGPAALKFIEQRFSPGSRYRTRPILSLLKIYLSTAPLNSNADVITRSL